MKERIMPFLWLNEETQEELAAEVRAMKRRGIDAFVIESRVHPDFCGERWFEEVGWLLELARSEQMKVWLLDDREYPTGQANGTLRSRGASAQAWRIKAEKTDIAGEVRNATVRLRVDLAAGDELLGVFLARREDVIDRYREIRDVSDRVYGDRLYIDIPRGDWSILCVCKTHGCAEREGFVDMLDSESVRVLIDAVYEPRYRRFGQYFGNTFAGFFSDEPRFANGVYGAVDHPNAYGCRVGLFGTAYPWRDDLGKRLGASVRDLLALWFDLGEGTADLRVRYMDEITRLYGQNFSGQLAAWCHAHGVLYTGHIIEDMGAHARLGCSTGHYFRSMQGADLASVDVVLHQIKPRDRHPHYAPIASGYADPSFFNGTLAKLASSAALLDPRKGGNALCEIFGAYGWCESISEMRWLVDHMLVRGINCFIPHAFYHREGLADCPPHFWRGKPTLTDGTETALFRYMARMCELLSGGEAEIDTAVLYHAEAEWTGQGCRSVDPIAMSLLDSQRDFDIVDFDALARATVEAEGFSVGTCRYHSLIVPKYSYLPSHYEALLERFSDFVTMFDGEARTEGGVRGLRVYRYRKDDRRYVMLFHEGDGEAVYRNRERLPYAVDYLRGYYRAAGEIIRLAAGETVVLQETAGETLCTDGLCEVGEQTVFDVSLMAEGETAFLPYREQVDLSFDVHAPLERPSFSGWVRYRFEFDPTDCNLLRVDYRGDGCMVSVGAKTYTGADRFVLCPLDKDMIAQARRIPVEITLRSSRVFAEWDRFSRYGCAEACMLDHVGFCKRSH